MCLWNPIWSTYVVKNLLLNNKIFICINRHDGDASTIQTFQHTYPICRYLRLNCNNHEMYVKYDTPILHLKSCVEGTERSTCWKSGWKALTYFTYQAWLTVALGRSCIRRYTIEHQGSNAARQQRQQSSHDVHYLTILRSLLSFASYDDFWIFKGTLWELLFMRVYRPCFSCFENVMFQIFIIRPKSVWKIIS